MKALTRLLVLTLLPLSVPAQEVEFENTLNGARVFDRTRHYTVEVLGQNVVGAVPCPQSRLQINVRDSTGSFVPNLRAEDFVLSVNGAETAITNFRLNGRESILALDLVFLIDGSRGFTTEIPTIIETLSRFDRNVRDSGLIDVRYYLVQFNNKIRSSTMHESAESVAARMQELWNIPITDRQSGYENTVLGLQHVASSKVALRSKSIRRVILLTDEAFQEGTNKPVNVPDRLISSLQAARVEVYPVVGDNGTFRGLELPVDEAEVRKFARLAQHTGGRMLRFDTGRNIQQCLHDILTGIEKIGRLFYSLEFESPAGALTADTELGLVGSDARIRGNNIGISSFPTSKLALSDLEALQQLPAAKGLFQTDKYTYYALVVLPFEAGTFTVHARQYKAQFDELSFLTNPDCLQTSRHFVLVASASPEWRSGGSASEIDAYNQRLSQSRLRSSLRALRSHPVLRKLHIHTLPLGRFNPFVGREFDSLPADSLTTRYMAQPELEQVFQGYRSAWFVVGVRKE